MDQAIVFNTQFYGPYLPVQLTDPFALLWATLSFVRHRFSFGMDWLIGEDVKASTATFGALFELLLLVLLGVLLVVRRQERLFRLGVLLIVPLAVSRDGFHLSPFVAVATFGCAHLIGPVMRWRPAIIALGVATLLVAVRVYFFALPVDLAEANELTPSLEPEPLVQRFASPDAAVLYLPIAPQGYLGDARRPGSFYTYFLPWIADVPGAQERLIADIEQQQVAVIVLEQESQVWDRYKFSSYAPKVNAHILSNASPTATTRRRGCSCGPTAQFLSLREIRRVAIVILTESSRLMAMPM